MKKDVFYCLYNHNLLWYFFSFKKESMASQSFGDSYMLFKLKELFIIQFIVSPSIHNIVSS